MQRGKEMRVGGGEVWGQSLKSLHLGPKRKGWVPANILLHVLSLHLERSVNSDSFSSNSANSSAAVNSSANPTSWFFLGGWGWATAQVGAGWFCYTPHLSVVNLYSPSLVIPWYIGL